MLLEARDNTELNNQSQINLPQSHLETTVSCPAVTDPAVGDHQPLLEAGEPVPCVPSGGWRTAVCWEKLHKELEVAALY